MHEQYPVVFQTEACTRRPLLNTTRVIAHTRGVLIYSVIVAKQHLLSTGKSRCLIPGQYTGNKFKKGGEILHSHKETIMSDVPLCLNDQSVCTHASNGTALRLICMWLQLSKHFKIWKDHKHRNKAFKKKKSITQIVYVCYSKGICISSLQAFLFFVTSKINVV